MDWLGAYDNIVDYFTKKAVFCITREEKFCYQGQKKLLRSEWILLTFCKRLLKSSSTINKLTRKNAKFKRNNKCEKSFQELKQRLVIASMLTLASGSGGYIIHSYASRKDLGCV